MSSDRGLGVSAVVRTCSGILRGHEKEQNPAICNHTGGPERHDAQRAKSDRERQMPHDFAHLWHRTEKTSSRETATDAENTQMATRGERRMRWAFFLKELKIIFKTLTRSSLHRNNNK